MKVIAIVKYAFTLVGIGMLIGSLFMYRSTSSFLEEAVKAEGTVVELVRSRSGDSTTYQPVVQFTAQHGQPIEFISSTGSNPPSYSEGQNVEVLYRAGEPQNARISGFFSLWGGAVILGGIGGVFFLIGAGIILVSLLKTRKDEFLKTHGIPIETEYQSVELNTALSVNGKHPFRVLSHWQNPSTSDLHIFKSNNLWFDPSNYIKDKKITVFIEPGNPKKYYVDLSFLPKLA
ncbi:DUF3592 domain-containing protein [Chromatiaceae bacterium AAb-1]|nr:DUF3592 domain-containing protein [Chromatiaceae bacterium AAb-1]